MTTFLALFAIYLIIGWAILGPDITEYVKLSKTRKRRDIAVRFAVGVGILAWPLVLYATRASK